MEINYYSQRSQSAYRLSNPRLNKISLHTFRHWYGTMEYHKTKDIIHVQQRLGHKEIENTMVYITIEEALYGQDLGEFYSATAKTVEETCKLVENGFDYVCEFDGVKVFRKRK